MNANAKPVQSTPQNRGITSRMVDEDSDHTNVTCDPYLRQDIAAEQILPVEEFMEAIWHRTDWKELISSKKVKSISDRLMFKKHMKAYREATDELDLYDLFATMANAVLTDKGEKNPTSLAFCQNHPIPITGSNAVRKPDGMGGDPSSIFDEEYRKSASNCKDTGPEEYPFHWIEFLCYLEFKLWGELYEMLVAAHVQALSRTVSRRKPQAAKDRNGPPKSKRRRTGQCYGDVKVQCARYAVEMLSNGALRTHAIGLYIDECEICLHFFDRSIFISSEPISFRDDPRTLIALLLILNELSDEQWGYMPGFSREIDFKPTHKSGERRVRSEDLFVGKTLRLNTGEDLVFDKILSRSHGLIGRGTIVIRTCSVDTSDSDSGGVIVVKLSSPARSRRNEKKTLDLAYEKATGDFESMRRHLPKAFHCEDIALGANSAREKLCAIFTNDVYESRALRLITFLEFQPILQLFTASDLCKVFRDIFNCYRWLYEEVKILHRDVSIANMMYYRSEDGRVHGILNDFDLATVVGDAPGSSKQRTGTKAFMAHELLINDTIPHLYRYDLESFFYVILVVTTHFENGEEIASPPYKDLFTLCSRVLLISLKNNILLGGLTLPLASPTPPYTEFRTWLHRIRCMFQKGMETRAYNEPSPDDETLGGHITFEKMAEILNIDPA